VPELKRRQVLAVLLFITILILVFLIQIGT